MKSTALRHPESVRLEAWGAVGNRTFYLCDRDGRMVTGTRFGHLVRIGSDVVDGELRLTFPDGGAVVARPEPTGDLVTTDFYGRAVTGRVAPGPWDGPLRALTGIDVRLVVPDVEVAHRQKSTIWRAISSRSCCTLGL